MEKKYIKINKNDNCAVALENLECGTQIDKIHLTDDIPFGHKLALCDIPEGGEVIKYGCPIGRASENIKKGAHIHSHNLKTALENTGKYEYRPEKKIEKPIPKEQLYFNGYRRADGRTGIRNEIWIIPTVGCVNKICRQLASEGERLYGEKCDGIFSFEHPYGCSQLGGDLRNTQNILAAIAKNGNAGGVLIVSLGCENNNLNEFMPLLDGFDKTRIRALVCQESGDEISDGLEALGGLADMLSRDKRTRLPVSELTVGFKCGGSDGFSGITANALCGRFTDLFTLLGGKAVLTETPEMFGAEKLLMNRARDEKVFGEIVDMINGFKEYFVSHGQTVYENPSPGNKAGGITTLEEKSLGCVQKGGAAEIVGVLPYGGRCRKSGLSLLTGPGNDIVSCAALAAAGANLILFTTGRGTPFGAPVPTVKISSNTPLYEKKPNWIDYNAGEILSGKSFEDARDELTRLVISISNGEKTKNEMNGCREIAILKDGVTL